MWGYRLATIGCVDVHVMPRLLWGMLGLHPLIHPFNTLQLKLATSPLFFIPFTCYRPFKLLTLTKKWCNYFFTVFLLPGQYCRDTILLREWATIVKFSSISSPFSFSVSIPSFSRSNSISFSISNNKPSSQF